MAQATQFPAAERQWLLNLPRIGPTVVDRLEQAGYGSLDHLRAAGPDAVVEAVCRQVGSRAWGNRRRALTQALSALGAGQGTQAAVRHSRPTVRPADTPPTGTPA